MGHSGLPKICFLPGGLKVSDKTLAYKFIGGLSDVMNQFYVGTFKILCL